MAAFIVRMLMRTQDEFRGDSLAQSSPQDGDPLTNYSGNAFDRQSTEQPQMSAEVQKWQRRFNRVKLRNLSPNHRSNDVIVGEDKEQVLSAKFTYGPLDFVLSGEKIEIFVKVFIYSNFKSLKNPIQL